MELSGQLPDGAAGMLDDVDITQDDTVYCNIKAAECVNEITLTDEQINQLERIYNDKPSSISSNAIMRKQVTYINRHRRTVRITKNVNVSEPHTRNANVSEPHTRNVNVSEPHTRNVNVSEPHTRNVNVSEPHTRNANMSEPHTRNANVSLTLRT